MEQCKLTQREIDMSFRGEAISDRFPEIMHISQLADLLQVGRSTIYQQIADSDIEIESVRVGTGANFDRDRFLKWYFSRN